MGAIDDITGSGAWRKFERRLEKIERGAQLGYMSVSRGGTRFLGNESLKVVGSALVSGWLIITGTLKIVGSLLMEGQSTFSGGVRLQNLNGNAGAANLTIDAAGNLQRSTYPTEANITFVASRLEASIGESVGRDNANGARTEQVLGYLDGRAETNAARIEAVLGYAAQVKAVNDSQATQIGNLAAYARALNIQIALMGVRLNNMDGQGGVIPPNPGV